MHLVLSFHILIINTILFKLNDCSLLTTYSWCISYVIGYLLSVDVILIQLFKSSNHTTIKAAKKCWHLFQVCNSYSEARIVKISTVSKEHS